MSCPLQSTAIVGSASSHSNGSQSRLVAWQKNLGQCQLVMNQVKMQMEEANKRGQAAKKGR